MKGVIYARYSCDNQREESIEGQLRDCKEYAKRHDILVVDTYIDRAFSAKTDRRPAFQQMIKDSTKRGFEAIIVWKLDRFARNRYDSATYKENFVKTVFVSSPPTKTSPKDPKAFCWNRYWRAWRNTTPPTSRKRYFGDTWRTPSNARATAAGYPSVSMWMKKSIIRLIL